MNQLKKVNKPGPAGPVTKSKQTQNLTFGLKTYFAAKDNSTMEVAAAADPGWKDPAEGAVAEKSAMILVLYRCFFTCDYFATGANVGGCVIHIYIIVVVLYSATATQLLFSADATSYSDVMPALLYGKAEIAD